MRYLLALILLLPSCSLTDIVPAILPTDKPSIEANVNIGKTNVQDKSLATIKGEDKRQIADTISNTRTTKAEVINNTNIPIMYMVLLVLGWLAPTPTNMWKGLLSLFKRNK